MEYSELIRVLEAVLGPVVADLSTSLNDLLDYPRPQVADGQQPADTTQGTVTSLLASRPDVGLAILDPATLRIRMANAAFLKQLGRSGGPEDATDRSLDDLAPQLAGTELDVAFRHVAATGYTFAAIIAQDSAAGSAYLRCALSPIRLPDGTFDALLLTLIDISAEVAARELLLERSRVVRQQAASMAVDPLRDAVRAVTTDLLTGAMTMEDALARVGETIGPLGDCAAIFALGDGNIMQLATLFHRDSGQAMRLRAAFTEDAPTPDGNFIAQVALSGQGELIAHWTPQHTEQVAAGLRPDLEAAHIESLVCVPMRAAPHTVGVLVLFSAQVSQGGTGIVFQTGDVAVLQEVADQLALAIQTVLLREDLRATQAEHAAVLEASSEGIAIYDAAGRLRLINPTGRELLSRPSESGPERGPVSGPALFKRTFLDADGRPLQPDELPWARALRGDRVGETTPIPIIVEWAGGVRRELQVRAVPIAQDDGNVTGATATLRAASAGTQVAPAITPNGPATAPAGEVEWAHWRETMELLDEAVVLCEPDGTAVFVNASGRALLNLPGNLVSEDDSRLHGDLWAYVHRADGMALSEHESPVALALAGRVVRAQPTSVTLSDGTRRPVMWDARRIDRADGTTLGVALIAWTVAAVPLDAQDTQPTAQQALESAHRLPTTTLLPGRKLLDHLPTVPGSSNGHDHLTGECDLTEVCAREARAHRDTAGRRLEIRLPRRRVLVPAQAEDVEHAVTALISAAATALPAGAPLHLAVWVERSSAGTAAERDTLVPQGIDIGQLNTLMLTPGGVAELMGPTRAVVPGAAPGALAAVAIVRVCSPNVRAPATETEAFASCRALVEQIGGRAWARVDPVLGPTFSFSAPVIEAQP